MTLLLPEKHLTTALDKLKEGTMRKRILLVLTVFLGLNGMAQDPVLMTVGDQKVTKSEFEQIFFKNYKKETVSKEDLDEYMVLFKKFKLKVLEAENRGMDEEASFKKELDGYRKQLVRPYMVDKEMDQNLIDEAYERMQTEVRASHIMVRCNENAPPADTLIAYNKAMKIRERILNGQEFIKVAKGKGGSEDPSAQQNGGDLGFFKAFDMVYPFENAVYALETGDLSQPVRTRYGYHIIKKTDEREARGEVKVAHILIAADKANVKEDKSEKKIKEIYELLKGGEDFASLAKKYSDDKKYGANGGELPMFSTGKMIPEFEDVSFGLKNNGDYSEPFKTDFGWHIVKKLDYKPVSSKEDMLSSLKAKVKRDTRSNKSKSSFLVKLKKEYDYAEYEDLDAVINHVDSTIFEGKWEMPFVDGVDLFSFANNHYTTEDFMKFLENKQRKERVVPIEDYVKNKYRTYTENLISAYEESQLENKYPEFKALMKEYREGILLFEITEEEVWGKAQKDSAGLEAFYQKHKHEFMWEDRVAANIFTCPTYDLAKKTRKLLKKKKSHKEVVEIINKDSELNVKRETGKFEIANRIYLEGIKKTGVSKVICDGDADLCYVIDVEEILPAGPKALSEARGPIIAKYQNELEENWIAELQKKYPIKVNEDVLYSIKK